MNEDFRSAVQELQKAENQIDKYKKDQVPDKNRRYSHSPELSDKKFQEEMQRLEDVRTKQMEIIEKQFSTLEKNLKGLVKTTNTQVALEKAYHAMTGKTEVVKFINSINFKNKADVYNNLVLLTNLGSVVDKVKPDMRLTEDNASAYETRLTAALPSGFNYATQIFDTSKLNEKKK